MSIGMKIDGPFQINLPPSTGGFPIATAVTIVDASGNIQGSAMLANSVDTGQLAVAALQYATVNLSSAQILALNGTPITLVAAQGTGTVILVENIEFKMVTTSTQYAAGGNVTFQYSGGNAVTNNIGAAVITAAAGTSYTIRQGIDVTAVANTAVTVTNATAAFTTGTGTAVVNIKYRVLTL